MKAAVVGALIVLSVVMLASASGPEAASVAAAPVAAGSSGELITLASALGEHRQQLTLIDPRTRVMGIYHVDS
ncbi:MAG TPA: hypothetical protein VHY20_06735, partial [Pirellulales bacterium]|nr:hypothetical protein [Pirellulales bacterium]